MSKIELKGELTVNDAENTHKLFSSVIQKKSDIEVNISKLEDLDVSILQLIYSLFLEIGTERKLSLIGPVTPLVKKRLYNCGVLPNLDLSDSEVISTIINTLKERI